MKCYYNSNILNLIKFVNYFFSILRRDKNKNIIKKHWELKQRKIFKKCLKLKTENEFERTEVLPQYKYYIIYIYCYYNILL